MKKKLAILSAVVMILALFVACDKTDTPDVLRGRGSTNLKVENYSFLGDWHNEFLENAKEKSDSMDDRLNLSQEKAMDTLLQININYAKNTIPNHMDFNRLKEEFNNYSYYSSQVYMAERVFLNKELRSRPDDGLSVFEMIDLLKKEAGISVFSESLLLDLTNNLKLNYERNLSDYEMKQVVLDLCEKFDSHGFQERSIEGEMIGVILAISKASMEFWEKNPELLPSDTRILPWVSNDIAGAILGAVSGTIGSLINNGHVSAGAVAYSAVAGAVIGSTGLVGKFGKWIQKIAPKTN